MIAYSVNQFRGPVRGLRAMSKALKILVADDQEAVRSLIRRILAKMPEWTISAEVADGQEAVELAKKDCPDLAILDIQMPRLNGIQAAEGILQYCPNAIILSDSMHDATLFSRELQNVGIKGFVCKPRIAQDLVPAVEAVINGETSFTPVRD